jgi:hypothetical protein
MADKYPIFPDITPSSIKKRMCREIIQGDLSSNDAVQQLILLMFHQPECAFHYYAEYRTLPDAPLKLAEDSGDILVEETVMFYYKHPNFKRDFVHIEVRDGNFQQDWEREVVEKGPMFTRSTIRLSERKRRELDALEKIEIEEKVREQRLKETNIFAKLWHDPVWSKVIAVAIVAIAGSVGSYFAGWWPASFVDKKQDKHISQGGNPQISTRTLHDLFLTDFTRTHIIGEYYFNTNQEGPVYRVEYILWSDFDTKTIFYSVFLPTADYAFDYTSKAAISLIQEYREILHNQLRSLMQGLKYHAPGSKVESWDELTFSGRVYIYHEAYLSPEQIDSLVEEYKKQGLSPQFRGRDYLIMKNSPLFK